MAIFIGDYNCKIDPKGRVTLPSTFKKQMPAEYLDKFVIKKDIYEKCLVLYPIDEWERQNKLIRQNTNPYNREHNKFLREFYKGTAEVSLDGNSRILIPKRLLNIIDAENEIVLAGQDGKIEIWAKDNYERASLVEDDFAELAEKIMGNISNEIENK